MNAVYTPEHAPESSDFSAFPSTRCARRRPGPHCLCNSRDAGKTLTKNHSWPATGMRPEVPARKTVVGFGDRQTGNLSFCDTL
jgi:hypothetical protein